MDFAIVRAAVEVNARQHTIVVRKVRCAVTGSPNGSLAGVRIGLLGLAFKAGTDDLRDSPAVAVAAELARRGDVLTAYDPCVPAADGHRVRAAVQVVDDPYLAAKNARALVVLTEWPEFRELDWAKLAYVTDQAVVVDTRNLLGDVLAGTGFTRTGIGTGATRP